MKLQEVLVTPDLAYKWLEGNVHNRRVRDSVVARYARDMRNGDWLLTHQPIAFSPDSTLVDGQHRLFAVIEANVAVRMMVAYDVDMAVQGVIDDNLPRTMVDIMRLVYDADTTNTQVAIAKRLRGAQQHGKFSRQEIVETLKEHGEAIQFATQAFPKKVRGVTIVPVMTALARAYYTVDAKVLERFATVLSDGRQSDPSEEPVIMLRNYLLTKTPSRGPNSSTQAAIIYGKTERALFAYVHGELIGRLYEAEQEMFPLPSEQKPKSSTLTRRVKLRASRRKTG